MSKNNNKAENITDVNNYHLKLLFFIKLLKLPYIFLCFRKINMLHVPNVRTLNTYVYF